MAALALLMCTYEGGIVGKKKTEDLFEEFIFPFQHAETTTAKSGILY